MADRETIRALLTDTVTLLCRNSLPFTKLLKVQGLLGITVDETDVYIIQIDEEYGEGGPQEAMGRAPVLPMKRPRTVISRTPSRRVPQTVPRRVRGGMTGVSPSSTLARQKVRQQLNFPSPQRGIQMTSPAAVGSPANVKQIFGMRSPLTSPKVNVPLIPTQASPMRFAQSPRMPQSQQKPRKMLMLEEGKKPQIDKLTPVVKHVPIPKVTPKTERVNPFASLCQRPVKAESTQRDIICVESDEENSDVKRMPDLLPFSSSAQSSMQDTVEDDKTKALQAIMNQALNEARAVGSGLLDQGDSYIDSYHTTTSNQLPESAVKKMEPVSSSQLMESDMGYDAAELSGAQFHDDFNCLPDMKPFFDQNPMQMSWDNSNTSQTSSSPSWNLPSSQSSMQPIGSPSWIKMENPQVPQKMMTNMAQNKGTPLRTHEPSSGTHSSPQFHRSASIPARPPSGGSLQQHGDVTGSWKSVTTTKFICSINNCDKEFTTKRAMRHHQKTLHGAVMGGHGATDSSSSTTFQYDGSDI